MMLRENLRLPGAAFEFDGRNRRPPRDPVNCLLSYTYALLTKDLTATAYGVGFDPYLGFYHREGIKTQITLVTCGFSDWSGRSRRTSVAAA